MAAIFTLSLWSMYRQSRCLHEYPCSNFGAAIRTKVDEYFSRNVFTWWICWRITWRCSIPGGYLYSGPNNSHLTLYRGSSDIGKNLWLPASADIHERDESQIKSRRKKPTLFILLGLIGLAEQIGEGASGDWGGVLSKNTFHASPLVATLPYIFFSAAMVIGRFNGDRIAQSIGNQRTLLLGGLLAGSGLTTGIIVGHTYGIIIAWTIVGLGVSVTIPILFSAVGSLATQKYPGIIAPSEGVALVSGVAYFGFVVGPPLMGFAADQITLRWAMLIPAALYFIFAAGSFITKE